MLILYGMTDSGNCYKPRLLMAKLGIPFRHVEVDPNAGGTRDPAFLALNPVGKVPLLVLRDGRVLSESNAILLHLAEGSRFLPHDAYERAVAFQWMFFEQYSHEPYVAVRRSLMRYRGRASEAAPERLAALLEGGTKALQVMEGALRERPFLAGGAMSVADIALFAYTREAGEAGFDMAALPAVNAWLGRVEADSGHVPMSWLPG